MDQGCVWRRSRQPLRCCPITTRGRQRCPIGGQVSGTRKSSPATRSQETSHCSICRRSRRFVCECVWMSCEQDIVCIYLQKGFCSWCCVFRLCPQALSAGMQNRSPKPGPAAHDQELGYFLETGLQRAHVIHFKNGWGKGEREAWGRDGGFVNGSVSSQPCNVERRRRAFRHAYRNARLLFSPLCIWEATLSLFNCSFNFTVFYLFL